MKKITMIEKQLRRKEEKFEEKHNVMNRYKKGMKKSLSYLKELDKNNIDHKHLEDKISEQVDRVMKHYQEELYIFSQEYKSINKCFQEIFQLHDDEGSFDEEEFKACFEIKKNCDRFFENATNFV